MHIGGACSNSVVRSADPSAGGHGVSPVMLAPGPGSTTVSPVGRGGVGAVARLGAGVVVGVVGAEDGDAAGHHDDRTDDQAERAGLALALDLLGGRSLRLEADQPALVLALSLLARHGGEQ